MSDAAALVRPPPMISIVTISFNQARFLPAAIDSIVGQDYPGLDYIVVDPGSTDGSRDIIAGYGDRIATVLLDPDNGPADVAAVRAQAQEST